MDWVNLLQDGAIICLAITQIAGSFSIRGLRKQVEDLRKSKQDKDHDLPLIESYGRFGGGLVRSLTFGNALEDAASRETRAASGFKPCLFRKGDSVRLGGLDGEFILIGYSQSGFSAVEKTGLLDLNEGSSIVLRVCPEGGRITEGCILLSCVDAMPQRMLSYIPRALSRRARPLGNPKNLPKASTSSKGQGCSWL